jgi:hypothetical protein
VPELRDLIAAMEKEGKSTVPLQARNIHHLMDALRTAIQVMGAFTATHERWLNTALHAQEDRTLQKIGQHQFKQQKGNRPCRWI